MPARDDVAALEAKRDTLREELSEATRKADALRAATRDPEPIEREIAALDERLAGKKRRRLSLLDDIRIASPCTARWEAMTGDERVRFCGECQTDVYNLSAMTREEAEVLIAERAGSICVRLYRREDGTVLTTDCAVGVRKKRRRAAVVAAGASALAATAAAFGFRHEAPSPPIAPLMGTAAPTATPAPNVDPRPTMGEYIEPHMGKPLMRPLPAQGPTPPKTKPRTAPKGKR